MTRLNNPFTISFGIEPYLPISRDTQLIPIYNSFISDIPDNSTYIITGPRGSGKTVALTSVSSNFKSYDKWIVVDINPEIDILEQLAAKLYEEGKVKKLFLSVEFNFSFKGIGLTINGKTPISNVSSLLSRELEYLKNKGYRVLITIDEVVSNQNVKTFAHEFQSFLRNKYPTFLLMTGLHQNISILQNQQTLTFLYRAPKIYLDNLNLMGIFYSYKNVFKTSDKEALALAKLTNGYAYGYQLLGNIMYDLKTNTINNTALNKYDELLKSGVYDKIFFELSKKEKEILFAASENPTNAFIMKKTHITKSMLSNYKRTFILKGLIEESSRNEIIFKLPRFKEYLLFTKEFDLI